MIKGLQLKRGDCVIGDVVSDIDSYVLKNACVLVMSQTNQPGHFGVELFPYNPFSSSETSSIPKDMVAECFELDSKLRNQYSARFGGIAVPEVNVKSLIQG